MPRRVPKFTVSHYGPMWGSHMPVLIKVFEMSKGPVLELGMGVFSTPLLHMLCSSQNRLLVSYEDSPYYVDGHCDFVNRNHQINLVNDWDSIDIEHTNWGFAFIDCIATRRAIETEKVANLAQFVVVHDTEPQNAKANGVDEVYKLFKYKFDYTGLRPNTSVYSNFVDISNLKI